MPGIRFETSVGWRRYCCWLLQVAGAPVVNVPFVAVDVLFPGVYE